MPNPLAFVWWLIKVAFWLALIWVVVTVAWYGFWIGVVIFFS